MPSVYHLLRTFHSHTKARYHILTRSIITSKHSFCYNRDSIRSQSTIITSSLHQLSKVTSPSHRLSKVISLSHHLSKVVEINVLTSSLHHHSKVADPGKLDVSTSSLCHVSRVVDPGNLDVSASSSVHHLCRIVDTGNHYFPTSPLHHPSKVVDLRKTLYSKGFKVDSGVFARSSTHSPVLHKFSHTSFNSSHIWLDQNQAIRSNWFPSWARAYSSNYTFISNKGMSNKIHSWDAISPPMIPLLSLCFSMQWVFRGNVISSEEEMHQIVLNKTRWTSSLEDSMRDNGLFDTKQGGLERSHLRRILSTSLALHFMQLGQSIFPMLRSLLHKGGHGFTCGGAAALMHLGLTFDCTADNESFEVKKKYRERSDESKGLKLLSAAFCLPHPDKEDTGGEDAYFICSEKHVVGVADGVGGWADVGVDAGEYARQLMNHSLVAVQQEPSGCIDTRHIMEIAHSKTNCRGSSTACILALLDTNLQATNLGDSGFLVVRNGRLVFKSPSQQHIFNFPFQLESGGGDPPAAAEVFNVEVAVGDVIVAGTDGLFDNLYDTEVVSMVVQATRSGASPDITAKKIASLAREHAADCNRRTPYASAAQDAGFRFNGGKMDDITVVVSYVVK